MSVRSTSPKPFTFAVVGNPNSGKSSTFNQLTGLRQKTGNFPGITVDKKTGTVLLPNHQEVTLIDFPGTYSFYPTSQDERIVAQTFSNPADLDFPNAIIYTADVSKLEKHLLLFSQIKDLHLPVILALNMADVADKAGYDIDFKYLSEQFGTKVLSVSARTGEGMDALKKAMQEVVEQCEQIKASNGVSSFSDSQQKAIDIVKNIIPIQNDFQALLIAHHHDWLPFLEAPQRSAIHAQIQAAGFHSLRQQVDETMRRFSHFTPIVQKAMRHTKAAARSFTEMIDAVLTHRVLGVVVFFLIMMLVFQAIFAWAAYPMDWIESIFAGTGDWLKYILGAGWLSSLLADGILTGLSGVLVFIPQIAILFLLISILEEVGYMARVAFLFDRLMQFFGMNGRSIVALISGGACAVPAIMSTRTISNWKERLITIMVTPLISCSARIPVYVALIAFVIPSQQVWGVFDAQGLAFMGLYVLGIIGALLVAFIFKLILKTKEQSFLMLELPEYRIPVLRNVWYAVWEKVKTFVTEAGKIIIVISIILWAMASFGPAGRMAAAKTKAEAIAEEQQLDATARKNLVAAYEVEASYAGIVGKFIEPAIRPLGFDWKIGIALLTSFAAREVFVSTMATIYSIGKESNEFSLRERLAQERDPITGEKVYNFATSLSLLLFYVFAMQCMSTLAIVQRETKSWKWPILQFAFMSALAYLSSFLVYQIFA